MLLSLFHYDENGGIVVDEDGVGDGVVVVVIVDGIKSNVR